MRRWWTSATLTLVIACLPLAGQAAQPAPLSTAESALVELGKELMDQSRPLAERLEISRAFAGWATPHVRATFLVVLKDPALELRAAAAEGLGWAGNREAVAALRERVEASEETSIVKAAALRSLGRIGDRSVRPLLVAATQNPDAGMREGALWSVALGPLVDPADRTSYLLRLADDRALDGQMRCDAIRALTEVKEDRVVDALMRILEHEPRLPVALPTGPPTQTQTMALRYAQARDVPAWAAGALGQLEAKRALPLLLKTAEDPEDFFLRLISLQALVAWGSVEALPVFVRRLEDPLPDNRIVGLTGLAKLGDRTVVPSVLNRLSDKSPPVRAHAVMTLVVLGDAKVRPNLEVLQKNETDSGVLGVVEEALSQLPR